MNLAAQFTLYKQQKSATSYNRVYVIINSESIAWIVWILHPPNISILYHQEQKLRRSCIIAQNINTTSYSSIQEITTPSKKYTGVNVLILRQWNSTL